MGYALLAILIVIIAFRLMARKGLGRAAGAHDE
jgi:hypothetical protein